MDRVEYLTEYCDNKKCGKDDWCDNCMYLKGKEDTADRLRDMFDYDLFKLYSNDDRFISFNNLSLMMSDMIEQLKEKNNGEKDSTERH